ncbi:MAG: hypothetical protein R2822_28880 [Spirosomataceae bacterium]
MIGLQLLGSIENDGYIRRSLQAIVNDLALSQGFYCTIEEVEQVLKKIQTFDPPYWCQKLTRVSFVAALSKRYFHLYVSNATKIIEEYFEEFSKKHYEKIQKRLNITDDQMKCVLVLLLSSTPNQDR